MRVSRFMAAAVVTALAAFGMAGAAEGDPAPVTAVTSTVTPAADGLRVAGDVTFAPYVLQVAEDAQGDATTTLPGELGTDITGATISSNPAKPTEVTFGMQLASLPAGGIGEAVIYGWDLLINDEAPKGGTSGGLEWKRTNVTAGAASANPYIRLRTCAPDATTGQNTCTAGNQLPGAMDATAALLTATTKLKDLGATPGARIGSPLLSIYHGTGVLWFPNISSDSAYPDYDFTVPSRIDSVKLAIVPSGGAVPASFPVATTPSGTGATGSYVATVPTAGLAPGAYDVVVQACWGGNCGLQRVPVTL